MGEVLAVETNEDGSQEVTMRLPAPPQTYPRTRDYEHDESEWARFSRLTQKLVSVPKSEIDAERAKDR